MFKKAMLWLKSKFEVTRIVYTNREIEVIYTPQAQLMIEQLKDFDKATFEKDFTRRILIGDGAIWRYILERQIKKLQPQARNK